MKLARISKPLRPVPVRIVLTGDLNTDREFLSWSRSPERPQRPAPVLPRTRG